MTNQSQPSAGPGGRLRYLFVCRGSLHDGLGHVTRSMAVAQKVVEAGTALIVIIGDEYAGNLLVGGGLDYEVVTTEAAVSERFDGFAPQVVIFDLMHFDASRLAQMQRSAMTVSLSPLFDNLDRVELLFHRSRVLDRHWLSDRQRPLIKSGLEYAVVGRHCRKIPEPTFQQNLEHEQLSLAVSMGGADAANRTLQVIAVLRQLPAQVTVWVMLGEGYRHSYQDLVDTIRGSPHEIILAKTNSSMWRVLSQCSLAILAGGTTTYEAAFAGLPSVNTLDTYAHLFLLQELVDNGVALCAGMTFEESLSQLGRLVLALTQDRPKLLAMHRRAHGLIDGLGARRIVDEMAAYYQNRPAAKLLRPE